MKLTIITGFLGAGKTTILNQIIAQHPDKKFGLIINEFGAEDIDGQIVEKSDAEDIVELANGCICCVVRQDLQQAALKLADQGNVDYILIETSGLAEPLPVAQTFAVDNLQGKISLDSIVCIVDTENYKVGMENFEVGVKQLEAADIVVLNKLKTANPDSAQLVRQLINNVNPGAAVIENLDDKLSTDLLIDTEKWDLEKLSKVEQEEHEHEHHHVDEVVFVTDKPIQNIKLQNWVRNEFPSGAVRAKGILRVEIFPGQFGLFLFQMVGANRVLIPFIPTRSDFDSSK
ncbi:GTP-binding protein, partial [Candidatus Dojkabacteria bacterium]|nr:GTP-binding protein [Candidatus Dojkabacteria bacterium]